MTRTPTVRPTRLAHLVGAAAAVLVGAWLVLRWWQGQGHALPIPGVVSWASVVLIALGLFWAAAQTRRLVARDRTLLEADQAVGRVVLGKTSQIAGSLLLGGYAALLAAALPGWPAPLAVERVVHAALSVAACVLLIVAGRSLERSCLVPEPEDEEGDTPPS